MPNMREFSSHFERLEENKQKSQWHIFLDENCLEKENEWICKVCNISYDNPDERYDCIKNHWNTKEKERQP